MLVGAVGFERRDVDHIEGHAVGVDVGILAVVDPEVVGAFLQAVEHLVAELDVLIPGPEIEGVVGAVVQATVGADAQADTVGAVAVVVQPLDQVRAEEQGLLAAEPGVALGDDGPELIIRRVGIGLEAGGLSRTVLFFSASGADTYFSAALDLGCCFIRQPRTPSMDARGGDFNRARGAVGRGRQDRLATPLAAPILDIARFTASRRNLCNKHSFARSLMLRLLRNRHRSSDNFRLLASSGAPHLSTAGALPVRLVASGIAGRILLGNCFHVMPSGSSVDINYQSTIWDFRLTRRI